MERIARAGAIAVDLDQGIAAFLHELQVIAAERVATVVSAEGREQVVEVEVVRALLEPPPLLPRR